MTVRALGLTISELPPLNPMSRAPRDEKIIVMLLDGSTWLATPHGKSSWRLPWRSGQHVQIVGADECQGYWPSRRSCH